MKEIKNATVNETEGRKEGRKEGMPIRGHE